MRITPIGNRIVCKPFDVEGTTKAGVIVPRGKGNFKLGKILAVGEDLEPIDCDDGEDESMEMSWGPPPVAVGDSVIYVRYLEITLADGPVNIIEGKDILGKVEQ